MMKPCLKTKLYVYLRALPSLVAVLLAFNAFLWLNGKFFEGLFFVIAFLSLRYKFYVTWHSKFELVCIILTIILWCSCSYVTLPKNVSILSPILIGFGATFLLWHIQDSNNKDRRIDNLTKQLLPKKDFALSTCNIEELTERCRERNIGAENIDIAIHYFVLKDMTLSNIAEKYCIDYDSAKQRVRRIKRKVE